MIPVVAVTTRDGFRGKRGEEWASDRLWLTKAQYEQIMRDQDSPDRRGRFYRIGNRVISIRDIWYVEDYDLSDEKVALQIRQSGDTQYLFNRVKLEQEVAKRGAKA